MTRALEIGLTITDLDYVGYGEVTDMLIEKHNDSADWQRVATQADYDAF